VEYNQVNNVFSHINRIVYILYILFRHASDIGKNPIVSNTTGKTSFQKRRHKFSSGIMPYCSYVLVVNTKAKMCVWWGGGADFLMARLEEQLIVPAQYEYV